MLAQSDKASVDGLFQALGQYHYRHTRSSEYAGPPTTPTRFRVNILVMSQTKSHILRFSDLVGHQQDAGASNAESEHVDEPNKPDGGSHLSASPFV